MKKCLKYIFIKIFFKISVLCLFFCIPIKTLASTCTGSVSYTWNSYSCLEHPVTGPYCSSATSHSATSTCGWYNNICGRCYSGGQICTIDSGGDCSVDVFTQGMTGVCGSDIFTTSGCTSCTGANGDCNDEAYSSGVCAASDITTKCDSTYGSSGISTSGSNFVWTCYEKCSGDPDTTNDSCSVPNLPTVNAVCGSAETGSSCTAPTSDLCSSGIASSVSTNPTTFTWTCTGSCGGGSDSCTKTKSVINGDCGAADGTCDAGQVVDVGSTSVRVDGIYSLWNCNSTCNGTNASCKFKICSPTNGVCGSTDGTCGAGNVYDVGTTSIKADGIYSLWRCNGTCNGTNDNCEYKTCSRLNGLCGTADGGNFETIPSTNLCDTGTSSSVVTNPITFAWNCVGSCSGTSDNCLATRDVPPDVVIPTITPTPTGTITITPTPTGLVAGTIPPTPTGTITITPTPTGLVAGTITPTPTGTITITPTPTGLVAGTITPTPTGTTVITTEPEITIDGMRLHSCQFPNPDIITISFNVMDSNGISDIGLVSMRFKGLGTVYTATLTPTGNPNIGTATFSNIDVSGIGDATYTLQVKVDDVHAPITSGWMDIDYIFKNWNCEVAVDGMFYDGSAEYPFTCSVGNNLGFTTEVPTGIPFNLRYSLGVTVKTMTNVSPRFTHPETLDWRGNYSPLLLNFPGAIRAAKIGDSNPICTIWNSSFWVNNYVNAWDTTPKIDIKYSAVMDQEAWYRVAKGSIIATNVANYVPPTCDDVCKTTTDGLIWANLANLSYYDKSKNFTETPKPRVGISTYKELKDTLFGEMGLGVILPTASVTKSSDVGVTGIVFVDGDLLVDTNINPAGYVFFIVNGDIGITDTVTTVKGILLADGEIKVTGDNNTPLKIYGSVYSKTGLELTRSYTTKSSNNTAPAIEIIYDPNLIFKLSNKVWRTLEYWRVE